MPSYELHKQLLTDELAKRKGKAYMDAHAGLHAEQLAMLENEGLLTDDEFRQHQAEGKPIWTHEFA